MRAERYLPIIILTLCLLSGCGTIVTRLQAMGDGQSTDRHNNLIASPVYSGVVYDWRAMQPAPGEYGQIVDILYLVDLPISGVADTLLLPFTLSGDAGDDSAEAPSRTGFPRKCTGFTVNAMNDIRWHIDEEEQAPVHAMLRIPMLSDSHSFYASATLFEAPIRDGDIEKLRAAVDAQWQPRNPRQTQISYESSLSTYKGQPCVAFHVVAWDKTPMYPKEPLVMKSWGYALFHPDSNAVVLDVFVSERGKPAELGVCTEKLPEEFFDSIEITRLVK